MNRFQRRVLDFFLPIFGGLNRIGIEQILSSAEHLDIRYEGWRQDLGAGSLWDLTAISAIAYSYAPKICFEIGTGRGRTSLALAANTPSEAKIYTLDISAHPNVGSIFRDRAEASKIVALLGDSKTYDFSPLSRSVDLVIVDGAHDYQGVQRDTHAALGLVRPQGIILWDDFCVGWPGVIRALRGSPVVKSTYHIVGTKLAFYRHSQ